MARTYKTHVVPNGDGTWEVKQDLDVPITEQFDTKEAAVEHAERISRAKKMKLVVHD